MLLVAVACGTEDAAPGERAPIFPADYAASYQEVRGCRKSADHDLHHVRVLASPEALSTYLQRDQPFPVGAVIVEQEYVDDQCSDLERFTAMKREASGYAPDAGDWHWQRLAKDRSVELDGKLPTCGGCHASCGVAPDGHDGTCAVP